MAFRCSSCQLRARKDISDLQFHTGLYESNTTCIDQDLNRLWGKSDSIWLWRDLPDSLWVARITNPLLVLASCILVWQLPVAKKSSHSSSVISLASSSSNLSSLNWDPSSHNRFRQCISQVTDKHWLDGILAQCRVNYTLNALQAEVRLDCSCSVLGFRDWSSIPSVIGHFEMQQTVRHNIRGWSWNEWFYHWSSHSGQSLSVQILNTAPAPSWRRTL